LTLGDVVDHYKKRYVNVPTRGAKAAAMFDVHLNMLLRAEVPAAHQTTIALKDKPIAEITKADIEHLRMKRREQLMAAQAAQRRAWRSWKLRLEALVGLDRADGRGAGGDAGCVDHLHGFARYSHNLGSNSKRPIWGIGRNSLFMREIFGRDGRIRTGDPLTPSQVRYQAALHPDTVRRRAGLGSAVQPSGPEPLDSMLNVCDAATPLVV
jgi:hypothetical protein